MKWEIYCAQKQRSRKFESSGLIQPLFISRTEHFHVLHDHPECSFHLHVSLLHGCKIVASLSKSHLYSRQKKVKKAYMGPSFKELPQNSCLMRLIYIVIDTWPLLTAREVSKCVLLYEPIALSEAEANLSKIKKIFSVN